MVKILSDRGKEKVCVCARMPFSERGGLSEFIIQLLPHVGHKGIIVGLHTHQV